MPQEPSEIPAAGEGRPTPPPQPVKGSGEDKFHLFIIGFGALLVIIGSLWTWPTIKSIQSAMASTEWPSVEGDVKVAKVEFYRSGGTSGHSYHYPVVEYSYEVNGQTFKGETLRFADVHYKRRSGKAKAREQVDPYLGRDSVPVYHDPADPANSVLEPGATWRTWSRAVNVGGIWMLGLSMILWDIFWLRKPAKKRKTNAAGNSG